MHLKDKYDFPIFKQHPSLVYFDHAATSQKPEMVISRMKQYLEACNGSPHRGAHKLSVEATRLYDYGRARVAEFIKASIPESIIFTKNATEALNLIAYSYGLNTLKKDDEIVVAITAHHSNLVPWQYVAKKTGAVLKFLYVDAQGTFLEGELDKINTRTKIVAFPWISNGLGCIHTPETLIELAHAVGAVVVLDAAQAAGHLPIHVEKLDVDFLVFSGHKMFGPTGIGVLYGKHELLDQMPPFIMGGDMIEYVEEQETQFAPVPQRFEAGTQHVEGVVGLTAAIDFIEQIGYETIFATEQEVGKYLLDALSKLDYVNLVGPKKDAPRGAMVTFTVEGIHPHDVASLLDQKGVAIRAGHHCTQPLMKALNLPATCRASYSIYNTRADVDLLIEGLKFTREVFGYVSG